MSKTIGKETLKSSLKNFGLATAAMTMLTGFASQALAELPVKLAPTTSWGANSINQEKINSIIQNAVAPTVSNIMANTAKYGYSQSSLEDQFIQANVKVLYHDNGDASHLLVNLLSRTNWGVETLRVNIDNDFNSTKVISNYQATAEDYSQGTSYATGTCPDNSVEMV